MMTSSINPSSRRSAKEGHKHYTHLRTEILDIKVRGRLRREGDWRRAMFHWCGCVHLPAMIRIVGRLIMFSRAFSFGVGGERRIL